MPDSPLSDPPAPPGEMSSRFASMDWSATALGPVGQWPQSLRTAVNICLRSRFPMFVWWGPDLINIYNDAYISVLGKRHPNAFGKPARSIWGEIWPVIGPQAEAVMQRGEATWNDRVLLVMERNGYTEDTYFTWSYSPILDEAGRIGGLFCACTEETQRVRAETERDRLLRQLDNERQRLNSAFDLSPAFMCVLRGPEHVFEFVNDQYRQLTGRRDLIGKPIRMALPEIVGQGFFELLDQVYTTGQPFVGRHLPVMIQRDPSRPLEERLVDFVYQAMKEVDGSSSGILVHGIDVTEQKHSEAALQKSEQMFRAAFDDAVVGMVMADLDGRVLRVNQAFCNIIGRPAAELIGRDSKAYTHPDDQSQNAARVWQVKQQTVNSAIYQKRYTRPDGQIVFTQIGLAPVTGASGKATHLIAVVEDITERHQADEALRLSEDRLRRIAIERETLLSRERAARTDAERASRMKDEFLATLSHELRTPLNAILGWSSLLSIEAVAPAGGEVIREGLRTIERNARAQAKIIEDLLDMSGIVSGKVRLDVEAIDLGLVIRAAIDTVRTAATARNIRLEVQIPAPPVIVGGDADRLQQVFWNLLSNAVKFTPAEGTIRIELHVIDKQAHVNVIDSGMGIRTEFLPHVFDRFSQADASTTRQHGGLGLGLAIVKQLIELHGGTVEARSAGAGQGASFIVRLPLARDATPAAQEERASASLEEPVAAYVHDQTMRLVDVDVLVVDDEVDARTLLKRLLEERGAAVRTAGDAEEALKIIRAAPPTLLISDISMPGMDGYSLMRQIRQIPPAEGGVIPAIALTAYARPEDRASALAAGFQDHLTKPVEAARLIGAVASLTTKKP